MEPTVLQKLFASIGNKGRLTIPLVRLCDQNSLSAVDLKIKKEVDKVESRVGTCCLCGFEGLVKLEISKNDALKKYQIMEKDNLTCSSCSLFIKRMNKLHNERSRKESEMKEIILRVNAVLGISKRELEGKDNRIAMK